MEYFDKRLEVLNRILHTQLKIFNYFSFPFYHGSSYKVSLKL